MQRRAHLMAHRGQESAFGGAERLGLTQRLGAGQCQLLALETQAQHLADAAVRPVRFQPQDHQKAHDADETEPSQRPSGVRAVNGRGHQDGNRPGTHIGTVAADLCRARGRHANHHADDGGDQLLVVADGQCPRQRTPAHAEHQGQPEIAVLPKRCLAVGRAEVGLSMQGPGDRQHQGHHQPDMRWQGTLTGHGNVNQPPDHDDETAQCPGSDRHVAVEHPHACMRHASLQGVGGRCAVRGSEGRCVAGARGVHGLAGVWLRACATPLQSD